MGGQPTGCRRVRRSFGAEERKKRGEAVPAGGRSRRGARNKLRSRAEAASREPGCWEISTHACRALSSDGVRKAASSLPTERRWSESSRASDGCTRRSIRPGKSSNTRCSTPIMEQEQQPTIRITLDDSVAQGGVHQLANIIHSPSEFVIDLGRVVPGRNDVKVYSRVIVTPLHAKQLLEGARPQHLDLRAEIRRDPQRRGLRLHLQRTLQLVARIKIIGAGLAGSECAYQLGKRGITSTCTRRCAP